MSLVLHCGAQPVSRETLATLPLPASLGPRHQPYPFVDYLDLVESALEGHALQIVDRAYGVTPDFNRFFGLLQLRGPDDYATVVGLRGSHDCRFARGLAVGSRVFVCDNLAFSGDHVFNTKQTTGLRHRLPALVDQAVDLLPARIAHQDTTFARFRATQLSPTQADALITAIVRLGLVPPSSSIRLIDEWDRPTHPEHAADGPTLWRLHNAVTEVLKPRALTTPAAPATPADRPSLPRLQARTLRLFKLFEEVIDPTT